MPKSRGKGGNSLEDSLEPKPAAGAMLCTGKGSVCGLVQGGTWDCPAAACCECRKAVPAHLVRAAADASLIAVL